MQYKKKFFTLNVIVGEHSLHWWNEMCGERKKKLHYIFFIILVILIFIAFYINSHLCLFECKTKWKSEFFFHWRINKHTWWSFYSKIERILIGECIIYMYYVCVYSIVWVLFRSCLYWLPLYECAQCASALYTLRMC